MGQAFASPSNPMQGLQNSTLGLSWGDIIGGPKGTSTFLTPEQQSYLQNALGGTSGMVGGAYNQFLQPYSPEQYEGAFQKGVVDPAMMQYEQRVLPAIQQRFVDANASSSSALNQAVASSAQDLTTSLGGQYLNFMQGQQQNTLNALGQLGGLAGRQTQEQLYQPGILGELLKAIAGIYGGIG